MTPFFAFVDRMLLPKTIMTKKFRKIVSDFANNDMPADVQEQFRCWMDRQAGDVEFEEQLLDEWNSAKLGPVNGAAYEQSFDRLMQSMPSETNRPSAVLQRRRIDRLVGVWRKAAAVLAVCCSVLGLGVLGARLFMQPENGIYVVTGDDNKGRFVLPDGTQVWLNYNSRLYYPESFDGSLRTVRLEGEALFNAVHDTSRPFRVKTSLMEIEVLGTVFDVKCYEHLDYAEVVLVSGSVKATCAGQLPVTLCPDERLIAYRHSRKIDYQTVDADNYNKWMFERQKLDEMRLDAIFVNLERRYNVEFDIAEDVGLAARLTLSLRNEPLEDILDAIALVVPIHYEMTDGRVFITRK